MENAYDDYLYHLKKTSDARLLLSDTVKKLGIPDIYIYDLRYTILFVIIEISFRDKGFFISSDLRNQTGLSDKSIERFIKFLLEKNFFFMERAKDKRIKKYFPSEELERHIRGTWVVRIKEIEALLQLKPSIYKEVLKYLKNDDYIGKFSI